MYGVTLMGDYDDLDKLYDSLSTYLAFYSDNAEYYPYHEYEYLLSLDYDIRHCYMGDRGYESVDNRSDRFKEWASGGYGFNEEGEKELKKLYNRYKGGNLYYSVEILYPLIFHYIMAYEMILEDEPRDEWFETESGPSGRKWGDRYSRIDMMRDRAAIAHLVGLLWENVQELLGREKADQIYRYYRAIEYSVPSSTYCDVLIHCQLVNFESMTDDEKRDYHLASIYEIIDVSEIEEYPDEYRVDADLYYNAVEKLNADGQKRFPVRTDFYIELDKIYDPSKPMYQDDFDNFLNDTYGEDPDPFETGEFNW